MAKRNWKNLVSDQQEKEKKNWKELVSVQEKAIEERKERERVEFDSFLSDSYDYLQREKDLYDSSDYDTYSDARNSFLKNYQNWKNRSTSAKSFLKNYGSSMEKEEYEKFLKYLDDFDKALSDFESSYKTKSDYYSQFADADELLDFEMQTKYKDADLGMVDRNISAGDISEDEKNWLQKNRLNFASSDEIKKEIESTKAEANQRAEERKNEKIPWWDFFNFKNDFAQYQDSSETQADIDDKKRYLANAERKETLKRLTENALSDIDFEKMSEYIAPIGGEGYNTRFYDQVNDKAPSVYTPVGGTTGVYGNNPTILQEYEFNRKKALEMTDEEKRIYSYYFNREEKGLEPEGTADEYLKAIELDARATETRNKEISELAKEDPIGSSLASVVLSPMKLPATIMDVAAGITDQDINTNDYYHQIGRSTTAARSAITEDMSDFGAFWYNTGMSMLDTGYNLALGGGSGFTTALMAMGAAGDAITSAKDRGASDGQAVMTGLLAGASEALFEKFSLGNLKAMSSTGGAGIKNFLKNWLKQAGVEASEETFTEIANMLSDQIVNRSLSEYEIRIQNYIDNGTSYEDAVKKASLDGALQIFEAAAGGFVSGTGFGVGGATLNAVNNRAVGKDILAGKQGAELVELAKTFDEGTITARRLAEFEKKTAKTGKENASYTGALYQAVAAESFENLSTERKSAIESAVTEKLTEKGLNTDEKTVRAVAKSVFGEIYGTGKLTNAEKKRVASEEYTSAIEEIASDPTLLPAIQENESFASAANVVDQVEEIALKSEATKSIADRVKSMNVSTTGADLQSLRVENNGKVVVVDREEKTSSLNESALTEDAALAVAYSQGMSPAKKKAFFESYSKVADSMPVDEYHEAFDLAYTYGLNGFDVEKAVQYAGPVLTEQGALDVFKMGMAQRGVIKKTADAEIEAFRKALGIQREGGTVNDKAIRYKEISPSDPRRAVVAFTKVVAQATGRNFEFFHTTAEQQAKGYKNGEYNPETNTIYIDINAGIDETAGVLQDQVLPTISHELVHIFAVEDPSGYEALADLVFAGLKESTGKTRASLVRAEMDRIETTSPDRFKGKSEETRRAIAEEEIVARACEDRLANSRLMKEFVSEMENTESGLAQKFSNFLGEAIDRLKKLFQQIFSTLSRSKEAQSLRKLTDRLEAIQTQFDSLLERRNTANAAENQANAAETTSAQQKNTSDRGVMNANRKEALTWDIPWDSNDKSTLAEQLKKHENEVNGMRPVAKVDYNESNGDYLEALDEILKKWNYKISRQKYGDFIFDDVVIKDIRRYVSSSADAAALISSPYVLKRGKIISGHKNHKNNGTTTITIAAPVILNNKRGNVAVTVMFGKGRVHSFKVTSTSDNKTFDLIKREAETKSTGRIEDDTIEPYTESASADSISNFEEFVNPQISPTDKGSMSADRSHYMTARELLLQAMEDEELKKSEVYSPLLREYANRVKELDKKYMQLEVAEHEYVASIDAFDSAKTQESYKNRVDQLTREINRIERDLSAQEENKELKDIVKREKAATRKQTLQEARADTSQRMSDYRKTVERKSVMEQIDVKARRLSKKLSENTRKSHIPDDLKQPLQQFLAAIESKSANSQTVGNLNFKAAEPVAKDAQTNWVRDAKNSLKDLRKAIEANSQVPIAKLSDKEAETQGGQYSGLLFIDPQILEEMEALAEYLEAINDSGEAFVLSEMDLDRLKQLNRTLAHVSKSVNSIDKAFAGQGKETISGLGASSMGYMLPMVERESEKKRSKLENAEGKKTAEAKKPFSQVIKDWTTWDQMTPYTAFSQFGEGGETVYKNILRGWGDYAFYAKEVLNFSESNWTAKEAKEWSETVNTYELAGQKFVATPAQIMYLYLLSQREQGKLHLNGYGFKIAPIELTGPLGGKKTLEADSVVSIRSTEAQREQFFEKHLPKGSRQREAAEKMQRFLADTCGAWGNELSYKLYGYRAFTDPNYVPITVDPTDLTATAGDFEGGMYRLLNQGFTKPLKPNSKDRVQVVNLFDMFAAHAADMAKYRSLALPIMDAIRWLNYRPSIELEDGTTERGPNNLQSIMDAAYGDAAFSYVKQFIVDLNGSLGKVDTAEKLKSSMIRAYKVAAVGANLKVAALQHTSYYRAECVLSSKSLAEAVAALAADKAKGILSREKVTKYSEEAIKNSGLALWKSLGYYDVGIGRSLSEQIKQYDNFHDKVTDLAMKGAEYGDRWTLGVLYKACRIELINSGKAKELSKQELDRATGELLDEVIYKSQVVDSTVTRSQAMRSKGFVSKTVTSFMSEPTVAWNMLLREYFAASHDLREGKKMGEVLKKHKRQIRKTFGAYALTALAAAAVETIFALWRDKEDEDETLLEVVEAFGAKFWENANPFTKISLVKDVYETLANIFLGKENYSDDMASAALNALLDTWKRAKKLPGDGVTFDEVFKFVESTLKTLSYFSGLPVSNAVREIKDAYNNTIGELIDRKIGMNEPSTTSAIKKAIKKGTVRETAQDLIDEKLEKLKKEYPNASISELQKKAKTSVKSSFTSQFKERYIAAYESKDREEMQDIRSEMRRSALYEDVTETLEKWEEAHKKDKKDRGLD